jgi:transketolase
MENKASWHHGVPTKEQYEEAIKEINQRIATLETK